VSDWLTFLILRMALSSALAIVPSSRCQDGRISLDWLNLAQFADSLVWLEGLGECCVRSEGWCLCKTSLLTLSSGLLGLLKVT
jgi:hypothetical protein